MKKLLLLMFLVLPFIAAGQLRKPSGKYECGVRSLSLIDSSRVDSALGRHREIPLTVWYPAAGQAGKRKAYVPDEMREALLESGYAHLDSQALSALFTLETNSIRDAAPVKESRKFPVVLFSAGWGMSTFSYTALIEDLVSHGIIVIAMDNLYCGPVRLADGRIITQQAYPYETYAPYLQSAFQDSRFVMDTFLAGANGLGFLKGLADQDRLGMVGHSIGGNVALLVAQDPGPFRFAINLDGGAFEKAFSGTMEIPAFTVRSFPTYTDAELSAKGRTRAGWDEMGATIDSVFQANLEKTRAISIEVRIPSTGHMSFSDAPFLMPDMLTRFGGSYLTP
ncbi:MAG TPA: hypothetical protein VGD92_10895, partial [Sphingobacteriaceae bacterium]